ncbi:hypothetical protein RKQ56_05965 [Acinetobacter baumannii]|uniref:hypothetical protein n=1 Tax=Acinetobacter baumannii TaxID=470 RepID=UPI00044B9E2B|nr:hypothetical protein [Acinetobacter baumannii]EXA64321.1 hypothetical protein J503_3237 [Acinetobacter baumannii 984213]QLB34872.1 hypothetical protein GQO96_05940 [Acinetobacter baumannii]
MSKLLINESPLQVQPSLAMAIGLNEAIFLQQLHYWVGTSRFIRDGQRWVYNTYSDWLLQLKYMSLPTLKRTIKSLKEKKLVRVERFDKLRSNQVNYYSIDYETLAIISENIAQAIDSIDQLKMSQSISSNCTNAVAQNEPVDQLKMSQSPLAQNEPMYTREYQETTQEITNKKAKPKFSLEEASSVELPEGVSRELWVGYIEMRFSMNKKPTPKAVEIAIKDLEKWGADKANQSLKNSITSNWTGLFEPKQAVQTYASAYSKNSPRNVNDAWANNPVQYTKTLEEAEIPEDWV